MTGQSLGIFLTDGNSINDEPEYVISEKLISSRTLISDNKTTKTTNQHYLLFYLLETNQGYLQKSLFATLCR